METSYKTEKCIYCMNEIGDKSYSHKQVNGNEIYWHYLCLTNETVELIPITKLAKIELLKFLRAHFMKPDGWQLEVLRSLES